VDPQYAAARHRFERVLTQRNHLLKKIREGGARRDELHFWDGELARDGGLILERRAACLAEISARAAAFHESLAPAEHLSLQYLPRIDGGRPGEARAADAYADALARGVNRDIAAGMTLQGPHRDDVLFSLDGEPASGFASRAQQRTIALSLRLAEARVLMDRRGEAPVLLLDDVLSEMDAGRRASVMEALAGAEQMLVTGTDWDRFPESFLSGARLFEVEAGAVRPLARDGVTLRAAES
jgi:DNA replication and repair protein RecF